MKLARNFRPQFESLDDRAMPSINLVSGVLTVIGTPHSDTITVQSVDATTIQVSNDATQESQTFDLSDITRIQINTAAGPDTVTVDPTLTTPTEIHGGQGRDNIHGGGGNDDIFGGRGRDNVHGGGGNDHLHGGLGDDVADGGDGDDEVEGALDQETELKAALTGANGASGNASFEFNTSSAETEREFKLEATGLPPNTTATVFVGGVQVGTFEVDDTGAGSLQLSMELDDDGDGQLTLPADFPEVTAGTPISVQVDGTEVLQGSFALDA